MRVGLASAIYREHVTLGRGLRVGITFFSCCLLVRNLSSSRPSKLLEEEVTFNKPSIFGFHIVVVRRIWMNHLSRSSLFQEGTPYIADKVCVICWGSLTNGSTHRVGSWVSRVPSCHILGCEFSPEDAGSSPGSIVFSGSVNRWDRWYIITQ